MTPNDQTPPAHGHKTKRHFVWKGFSELSADEVYEVLRLRQDVFILEQNCLFSEIDGHDKDAEHLLAVTDTGSLAGYCRICPPSADRPFPSIGRVVVARRFRRHGLGSELIRKALQRGRQRFPRTQVRVAAQVQLEAFYARFGFRRVSAEYTEDGIPHVDMSVTTSPSG